MKYIIKCKSGFMLLLYNKIYLNQVLALLFFLNKYITLYFALITSHAFLNIILVYMREVSKFSYTCVKCPNTEFFLVRIFPYSD